MRLSRVSIENFRGIRHLEMALDPVTVVVGENNHGKTSLFDVLALCLGRPGQDGRRRFRKHDFHRPRGRGRPRGPIRIVLTFESARGSDHEGADGAALAAALERADDGRHRLRVAFEGRPSNADVHTAFLGPDGAPLDPQPPSDALDALRKLHPVLLVRFAHPLSPTPAQPAEARARGRVRARNRPAGEIARVYHELLQSRGPVPTKRLRRALRSVRRAEESGPLQGILGTLFQDDDPDAAEGRDVTGAPGGGSHTLGLLMVLGALLEVHAEESLEPGAHPILAIEEPEAHLHPILLASTWDVIERLRAQTLITTNSGEFLSSVPLASLRRLARERSRIAVHHLSSGSLSPSELRRVGFHVRAKRGGVLFARCWLLVEGESEFWLMRELAHVRGYDLEAEGVRCVEFAQCGVAPLVKLANDLGIRWHLLTDGDESGGIYAKEARAHLGRSRRQDHVTRLEHRDVERCLWHHGFADLYREAAGLPPGGADDRGKSPGKVIAKAVRNRSKPYLALSAAELAAARGPDAVPPILGRVIEAAVGLARDAIWEG